MHAPRHRGQFDRAAEAAAAGSRARIADRRYPARGERSRRLFARRCCSARRPSPRRSRGAEELVDRVSGDRKAEAVILARSRSPHRDGGPFRSGAATLYGAERATARRPRSEHDGSSIALESSRVEMLAGDPEAADRCFGAITFSSRPSANAISDRVSPDSLPRRCGGSVALTKRAVHDRRRGAVGRGRCLEPGGVAHGARQVARPERDARRGGGARQPSRRPCCRHDQHRAGCRRAGRSRRGVGACGPCLRAGPTLASRPGAIRAEGRPRPGRTKSGHASSKASAP